MSKVHTFDSWSKDLNEGLFSSFKNALSRFFGGTVSKIDKVLKEYQANADDYWERWADARDKIAKSRTLLASVRDPLQREKYREENTRAEQLLKQVENTKEDVAKSLNKQGTLLVANSERLKDYWDLEKAKTDAEIAKGAYEKAKHITDDEEVEKLYDDIAKKVDIAKQKEKEFDEKFGHVQSMNTFMRQDHHNYEDDVIKASKDIEKSEQPAEAPKPEAPKAPTKDDMTKDDVEKFFRSPSCRGSIETAVGEKVKDEEFNALKTDLMKIYQKYTTEHPEENQHAVRTGLVLRFATDLFADKEKQRGADKPLNDKEIDVQTKKFEEAFK